MLAYLTDRRLLECSVRSGDVMYQKFANYQWAGEQARGNEIHEPETHVIDVDRGFVIGKDRRMYPMGWDKGLTPAKVIYFAWNQLYGFTLLWRKGEDDLQKPKGVVHD